MAAAAALYHPLSSATVHATRAAGLSDNTREFHVKPLQLDFKACLPTLAESAAAYDDSTSIKDEGLDISRLGISDDIVSALARRNIHHLLPIQVRILLSHLPV